MFLLAQRAILALCLIFLIGCSSPSCHQWELQEIITHIPCFNGGRLILGAGLNDSNLELELVRNRSGIRFYLDLLFLQAAPWSDDPTRTRIEVIFEEQEPWVVYPYLLEGGQRLLLPGDLADVLVQALLDGYEFRIQIGRSHVQVIPENFSAAYANLLSIPIEEDC